MKKASFYRQRAAFMRKMAGEANIQSIRDSYLALSLDWETMAEAAEGASKVLGDEDRPDEG